MYGGAHTRPRGGDVNVMREGQPQQQQQQPPRHHHSIAIKSPSPITPYDRAGVWRGGGTPGGPTPSPTAAYYAALSSPPLPPPLSPPSPSPSSLALRMMTTPSLLTTATTAGGHGSNATRCYAPPPPMQSMARSVAPGRANIFDDDAHAEAPVSLAGSPNATVYGTASPLAKQQPPPPPQQQQAAYGYYGGGYEARRRSGSSNGSGGSSSSRRSRARASSGMLLACRVGGAATATSARGSAYAAATAAAVVRPASATTTTTIATRTATAAQRPLTSPRAHGNNGNTPHTLLTLAQTARAGASGGGGGGGAVTMTRLAALASAAAPPPPPAQQLQLPATATASITATARQPSAPRRTFSDQCGLLVEEVDPTTLTRVARYRCGALLGSGGFAQVFEFADTHTGVVYACKILDRAKLGPSAEARVRVEVEIQRSLRHRHIVQVVKSFLDAHYLYILLECCSRKSLMDVASERGVLTVAELRHVGRQLASALAYMHARGVIHRDVKLANILIDRNGDVKLADFGFACRVSGAAERKTRVCGTPNYIAPEILACQDAYAPSPSSTLSAAVVDTAAPKATTATRARTNDDDNDNDDEAKAAVTDARTARATTAASSSSLPGYSFEVDVWSLGVLLFILAYGHAPFQARDVPATYQRIRQLDYHFPADADARVPDECRRLIAAMLHGSPRRRPTAAQLLESAFLRNNNSSSCSSSSSNSNHSSGHSGGGGGMTRHVTTTSSSRQACGTMTMAAAAVTSPHGDGAAARRAHTSRPRRPYPPAAVVHGVAHMSKYGYGFLLCLHGRVLPVVLLNDRTKLLYDGDSDTVLYFARQPRTSTTATATGGAAAQAATTTTATSATTRATVRTYCDELVVYEHATHTLGGDVSHYRGGDNGHNNHNNNNNNNNNNNDAVTSPSRAASADALLRRAAQKKLAITRYLYPYLLQTQDQPTTTTTATATTLCDGGDGPSVARMCTGFACALPPLCRDDRLFALDTRARRATSTALRRPSSSSSTPSSSSSSSLQRRRRTHSRDNDDEESAEARRCATHACAMTAAASTHGRVSSRNGSRSTSDSGGCSPAAATATAAVASSSSSSLLLSRPLVYVKEAVLQSTSLRGNGNGGGARRVVSLALRLSNQSFHVSLRFDDGNDDVACGGHTSCATTTTMSAHATVAAAAAAALGTAARGLPWSLDVLVYDNYHALIATRHGTRAAMRYTVYDMRHDVEAHATGRSYYACGATHHHHHDNNNDDDDNDDDNNNNNTCTSPMLTLSTSMLRLVAERLRAVRCPASIVECFD